MWLRHTHTQIENYHAEISVELVNSPLSNTDTQLISIIKSHNIGCISLYAHKNNCIVCTYSFIPELYVFLCMWVKRERQRACVTEQFWEREGYKRSKYKNDELLLTKPYKKLDVYVLFGSNKIYNYSYA